MGINHGCIHMHTESDWTEITKITKSESGTKNKPEAMGATKAELNSSLIGWRFENEFLGVRIVDGEV